MMRVVRTTVTLDADVEAHIKRLMRERGLSFKAALNDAVRSGMRRPGRRKFQTPTFDMGEPLVDLTKALRLAGELEDAEVIRKLAAGK